MSADMHYDYVEAAVGAWIGRELTPGMKISLSKRLKKLYQDRGILDANGRVINVEDWDNPHKIVLAKVRRDKRNDMGYKEPKN